MTRQCGYPVDYSIACTNPARPEHDGRCDYHRNCREATSGSWYRAEAAEVDG